MSENLISNESPIAIKITFIKLIIKLLITYQIFDYAQTHGTLFCISAQTRPNLTIMVSNERPNIFMPNYEKLNSFVHFQNF